MTVYRIMIVKHKLSDNILRDGFIDSVNYSEIEGDNMLLNFLYPAKILSKGENFIRVFKVQLGARRSHFPAIHKHHKYQLHKFSCYLNTYDNIAYRYHLLCGITFYHQYLDSPYSIFRENIHGFYTNRDKMEDAWHD